MTTVTPVRADSIILDSELLLEHGLISKVFHVEQLLHGTDFIIDSKLPNGQIVRTYAQPQDIFKIVT